jgi:hypothetical protein
MIITQIMLGILGQYSRVPMPLSGILAVVSIPAQPGVPILAVGFTFWTVECDILQDYRTMAIGFLFFSAIGLSEYLVCPVCQA